MLANCYTCSLPVLLQNNKGGLRSAGNYNKSKICHEIDLQPLGFNMPKFNLLATGNTILWFTAWLVPNYLLTSLPLIILSHRIHIQKETMTSPRRYKFLFWFYFVGSSTSCSLWYCIYISSIIFFFFFFSTGDGTQDFEHGRKVLYD